MSNSQGAAKKYLAKLQSVMSCLPDAPLDQAIAVIDAAFQRGSQIIALGNGGSALTALHFITDWNKSIHLATQRPFKGRSLVDNMGLLSAYSNDASYADVFAEQLKNIMQRDDLVIAISGSGNSENVIRAIDYANEHGGITLGLCGYNGGRLKEKAKHVVWVPVQDMQVCEDLHSIFGHIVTQALCNRI